LEGLAEAIVLDQNPNLLYKLVEHMKEKRKVKQPKRLLTIEAMRHSYRKLGPILCPEQH
jgi:hypothetical protein